MNLNPFTILLNSEVVLDLLIFAKCFAGTENKTVV
jgi:hypothetical protein